MSCYSVGSFVKPHRLLVRGHRTKTSGGGAPVPSDVMQYEPVLIAPFFAAPILLIALVWLLLTTSNRGRLRRSQERALTEVMNGTGTVVTSAEDSGKSSGNRPGKNSGKSTRRNVGKSSEKGTGINAGKNSGKSTGLNARGNKRTWRRRKTGTNRGGKTNRSNKRKP